MDEKYIQDLYNGLGGEGVFGKYEDFSKLISEDDAYRKDVYNGLGGEEVFGKYEDYDALVKKKGDGALVSPTGSDVAPTTSIDRDKLIRELTAKAVAGDEVARVGLERLKAEQVGKKPLSEEELRGIDQEEVVAESTLGRPPVASFIPRPVFETEIKEVPLSESEISDLQLKFQTGEKEEKQKAEEQLKNGSKKVEVPTQDVKEFLNKRPGYAKRELNEEINLAEKFFGKRTEGIDFDRRAIEITPEAGQPRLTSLEPEFNMLEDDYVDYLLATNEENGVYTRNLLDALRKKDKDRTLSDSEAKELLKIRDEAIRLHNLVAEANIWDIKESSDIPAFQKAYTEIEVRASDVAQKIKSLNVNPSGPNPPNKVSQYNALVNEYNMLLNEIDKVREQTGYTKEKEDLYQKSINSFIGGNAYDFAEDQFRFPWLYSKEVERMERSSGRYMEAQKGGPLQGVYAFTEGAVNTIGNMLTNVFKAPKVIGDALGDNDYDTWDALYNDIKSLQDDRSSYYGRPEAMVFGGEAPKYDELPLSYRLSRLGGEGVGSILAFAGGGELGMALGLGEKAALTATAFITAQSDFYDEAIAAGMNPKEAAQTGTAINLMVAPLEAVLGDVSFMKSPAGKSFIRTFVKGYKEGGFNYGVKQAWKALPESAMSYASPMFQEGVIEEGGAQLVGDIAKEVVNTSSSAKYQGLWDSDAYNEAVLGGALASGIIRTFNRPKAYSASPEQEAVLGSAVDKYYDLATGRPSVAADFTGIDSMTQEIVFDAAEIKSSFSAIPEFSRLPKPAQDHIIAEVIRKKKLQDALRKSGVDSPEIKSQIDRIDSEINNILANSQEISDAYQNQKQDDKKDEQGIPSGVREGEAPVSEQPVEGAGAEAVEAGGVLQAQEEVELEPTVAEAPTEELSGMSNEDKVDYKLDEIHKIYGGNRFVAEDKYRNIGDVVLRISDHTPNAKRISENQVNVIVATGDTDATKRKFSGPGQVSSRTIVVSPDESIESIQGKIDDLVSRVQKEVIDDYKKEISKYDDETLSEELSYIDDNFDGVSAELRKEAVREEVSKRTTPTIETAPSTDNAVIGEVRLPDIGVEGKREGDAVQPAADVGSDTGDADALKDVESTAKALEGVESNKIPLARDVASSIVAEYEKAKNEVKRLEDEKANLTDSDIESIVKKSGYKKSKKHQDKYEFSTGASIIIKSKNQIVDDYYSNKIKKLKKEAPNEKVLAIYRKQDKDYSTPLNVSKAYHAAKKDGSNPELVKAVKDLLAPKGQAAVDVGADTGDAEATGVVELTEQEELDYAQQWDTVRGSVMEVDPNLSDAEADYAATMVQASNVSPEEAVRMAKENPDDVAAFMAEEAVEEAPMAEEAVTEGEVAAGNVGKFLSPSEISVEVLDDAEYKNIVATEDGQQSESEGVFIAANKKIYINRDKVKGEWGKTIAYHEGTHPVVNIIRNTNPALYKAIVDGIMNAAKTNPNVARVVNMIKNNPEYKKAGQEVIEDETVVEVLAQIAAGKLDFGTFDKSTREKIIDFMNTLAEFFRLPKIAMNSPRVEVQNLAKKLTDALNKQGSIADVVGKKNVGKFQFVDANGNPIKDDGQFSLHSSMKDSKMGFVLEYLANDARFKNLKKQGHITEDKVLNDFNGKYIFLHSPDAAFTGSIKKIGPNGEIVNLVEGKGGVFYPLRFVKDLFVWASTSTAANSMAAQLNKNAELNNGSIYLALVSAPQDKLLSSTTSSNGVIDIFKAISEDKEFKTKKDVFKNALLKAAKATEYDSQGKLVGLNLKSLTQKNTAQEIEHLVREKLAADNSTFKDRKLFSSSFISEFAKSVKGTPSEQIIGEFLIEGLETKGYKQQGGKTETGYTKYSLSPANLIPAISQMMAEPMLKGESSRKVYAIIEVKPSKSGEKAGVTPVDSEKHESYPKAIKAKDKKMKVVVHVLQDREDWADRFADPETGEKITPEREKKIFPTSGVTTTSLKVLPKPSAQASALERGIGKYDALPEAPKPQGTAGQMSTGMRREAGPTVRKTSQGYQVISADGKPLSRPNLTEGQAKSMAEKIGRMAPAAPAVSEAISEIDTVLEQKGKNAAEARRSFKEKYGQDAYDRAREVTLNFDKIINDLEQQGRVRKDCP